MVEILTEDVRCRMVSPDLKRRVPSPSTNMPRDSPSLRMVTVVTVASRAAGRARLVAELTVIFARMWDGAVLRLLWNLRGLQFLEREVC